MKRTGKNPLQWTPCLTFTRATEWGSSKNWIQGGGLAPPALPAVKRRAAPPAITLTRAAPVLNYPSPGLRPRPVSNLRVLSGVSGITLSPANHSGYDSLTKTESYSNFDVHWGFLLEPSTPLRNICWIDSASCCWRRVREFALTMRILLSPYFPIWSHLYLSCSKMKCWSWSIIDRRRISYEILMLGF